MTDFNRSERPRQNLEDGISDLVRVWQEAAKSASDIAHARRQIFLAYVAEGFTEAQALDLIKSL